MTVTVLLSLVLGMALSLLFSERFALSPGGAIAPGVLALYLDDPIIVGTTAVSSILATVLVRGASQHLLLIGQRRVVALLIALAPIWIGLTPWPEDGAGLLVLLLPGLIAAWMDKQGVIKTAASLSIVSILARLGVFLIFSVLGEGGLA
jgi:poly-gamma-glutamate biosynthesis protein PgsC/CapC